MPFPWTRTKRHDRYDGVGVVDPDYLSVPGRPEPLTPVHRPDSIRVVRHARPLELSSAADWELEICQWVDELHDRGALDDGTYYVADEMIRTRMEAELRLIDDEARSATNTERGLLLGNDQANLQRLQSEVEQLRERDLALRVQIDEHVAHLTGEPDSVRPQPSVPTGPLPVRALPVAPDVTALLPSPLEQPSRVRTADPAGPEPGP